ncbi:spermidine/putrescine transport system substrate-binding protein [Mameliella alba]|uniref:extracellular solute-binding protein n=1 Tax=Mameliella TaxID=1434019 RepID=UPI00088F7754|nr:MULTISPECIES: extracellular solute-binding protein [Mameliella]MCR9272320.1 extracellular solute-binding protein [Paracoccaceae bacterium]OWV48670.1 ABC transporter substrate-binding protein [Mameliella alba]OWV61752.1 ABC transporter substrate-binding protein [Mameliella alba]PTR39226.1 spermidine/putrescine transport system substrate-binding protein [Mameliella alba]SDD27183.1 spermidine/putrescine transport system substrate-binding protein [Mameliella alba]
MKKLVTTAAALALTAGMASAEGKLVIYHWFEYIPQDLLDKFAEEHDVEVVMDTYDSNEALLASLKAGAIGTYDVAVPGDYMVQIMAGEGLLDTIEEGELANKGNIQPEWADPSFDPGRAHSIPYQWGSTSFAVNRDDFDGPIDSTDILFNPPAALSGKINMLDSQGEVMAMAALHMGIPQCSTDREQLKALNAMLQEAKQHWASFNSDTAKEVLVSGDASVGQIYDGFAAKARQEGANIEYAFPKQGYIVWMDNVVLLKDAPNRENALKFMDFLLEPENIAAVTNYARYVAGVDGVGPFLDPELAKQPESNPPADAGKGVFIEVCDQQTQEVYDQIWTNLKK